MKIIKPVRKKHFCKQVWEGKRDDVFPLLCPVKEKEWIPGWDLKLVISNSGVVEQECIFIEEETPCDAIWIVTNHDPVHFVVAMYRIVPGVVSCRFEVTLDGEEGTSTSATISYEQTALGKDGEKIVAEFTAESFTKLMDEFTLAINHYLATGKMVESDELIRQEAAVHHKH